MTRRPASIQLNGYLLAASLIVLALDLATGHVRGAIYATVAVIAFGSLLAVDIRENRANRPQVPLDIDPDALSSNDDPHAQDIHDGLPFNHTARLDGYPGLVWYVTARQVRGDQLAVGDWLDTPDHRGARRIHTIHDNPADAMRTVAFSHAGTQTVHNDALYPVVDPNSQVTPDGTPVTTAWPLPLWRRVLAGLLGVKPDRHDEPRAYRHHDRNHDHTP